MLQTVFQRNGLAVACRGHSDTQLDLVPDLAPCCILVTIYFIWRFMAFLSYAPSHLWFLHPPASQVLLRSYFITHLCQMCSFIFHVVFVRVSSPSKCWGKNTDPKNLGGKGLFGLEVTGHYLRKPGQGLKRDP